MFDLRKYITEANDSLFVSFTRKDFSLLSDKLKTEHDTARKRQITDLIARLKAKKPITKKDVDLVYHLASTTYAAGTSDQLHNLKRRLEAAV